MWRGYRVTKYILLELIPIFFIGVSVFIFIILMFQSFRLTEYVIVHGAPLMDVAQLTFYLSISFLPIVFPISLLFSVLLCYGRLNSDSEIVAFRSVGLNLYSIALPAILVGITTTLMSLYTAYYLAPWGNRQMEVLVHKIGQLKPEAIIREGTFSKGFFDLVVYANKVNTETGLLEKLFIYDDRNPSSPLTIIARKGKLIRNNSATNHKAFLRLIDGDIHKSQEDVYTKIKFDSYDISLFEDINFTQRSKSSLSLSLPELKSLLNQPDLPKKKEILYKVELHRRAATSMACLIFAFIGIGISLKGNQRDRKSNGFVMSIGIAVGYWLLYAAFESLGKNGVLPVALGVWTTDILLVILATYILVRNNKN